MLARIAAATEASHPGHRSGQLRGRHAVKDPNPIDLVSMAIRDTMEQVDPVAVVVPTRSGYTARHVARYRLPVWVTAVSTDEATCQALQFSWGVWAERVDQALAQWSRSVHSWLHESGYAEGLALLTQAPSTDDSLTGTYRMEILELG